MAAGPARASGDRDALSDETIGLMIDDSGPGQAEALLGVLYLRGMRIESDPIAASAWLDRAARAGHPAGIYGAARMHADGIGVPVDAGRARQLLGDADPTRFGPLADAVRRLRRDLGLPDAVAAPASPPDHDAAKPSSPTSMAAEVNAPPAPPPASAEPIVQPEPPVTAPAVSVEAALPAEPARTEPAQAEPAPASPLATMADPARGAVASGSASMPPPASPAAIEPQHAMTAPPADAIAGPFAQLATLFSEASTATELSRIRGIVPPHLLQGHELSVRTVRLGDGRTAWRIVATGFAHRDDVRIFCGLVTASGLGCLPRQ
ncbi:tetratricopeptide repeat protein [Azospirillum oleiclasticum]|uniref:tetratricopeptide repeat protein n=1 Tax=Azospirillum oleiclasticum TaxID=2735135 RepID=UPI0015D4E851|nr:hypothetical protein [Azospirillum oleiclasticum]